MREAFASLVPPSDKPLPTPADATLADLLTALVERLERISLVQTERIAEVVAQTRVLKGQPLQVFSSAAANGDSDDVLDCSGFNAVQVNVYVGGSSPSATISLKGAPAAGGNFLQLPDRNASHSVTADTSFTVMVGAPFVKANIASRTAGTFTVILTPFVAAGQAEIDAAAAQGSVTDRSGTITTGGSSQQVMAANPNRQFLLIQNVSTDNLWVRFGASAAVQTQPSIKLLPNSDLTFNGSWVPTQAVQIIGPTTSQAFTAEEG